MLVSLAAIALADHSRLNGGNLTLRLGGLLEFGHLLPLNRAEQIVDEFY
jgi:hypothetical protein